MSAPTPPNPNSCSGLHCNPQVLNETQQQHHRPQREKTHPFPAHSIHYSLLPYIPPSMDSLPRTHESEEVVVTMDVHAAKDLMDLGSHRYLDVRTVEEFSKGHPQEDAINIPYMFFTHEGRVKNLEFVDQVLKACDKEDHILVGCQSGVRSLDAAADLLSAGFKHVTNMGGGYLSWVENGYHAKGQFGSEGERQKEKETAEGEGEAQEFSSFARTVIPPVWVPCDTGREGAEPGEEPNMTSPPTSFPIQEMPVPAIGSLNH